MSKTFLNRQQFATLYGARIYALAKNIKTLYQKKMKVMEQLAFLRSCKQNNVLPIGLQLKPTTHSYKNCELLNRASQQLGNNLLNYKYKQQKWLNIELTTQLSILKWYLIDSQPERLHEYGLTWINKYDKSPREKLKKKHDRKLK